MQGNRKSRSIAARTIVGAGFMVRLLLVLLLAVQLLAVGFVLIQGELPVPRFLLDSLRERAAKEGYTIQWQSLHINLTGQVLVEGLEVGIAAEKHGRLLEADALLADFSLTGLVTGNVLPRRLIVSEATLFCPMLVSPTGNVEELAQNISINLSRHRDNWHIETFRARLFNLLIRADGTLSNRWLNEATRLQSTEEKSKPQRSFLQRYGDIGHALLSCEDELRKFENPDILLRFSPSRKTPATAAISHPAASKAPVAEAQRQMPPAGKPAGTASAPEAPAPHAFTNAALEVSISLGAQSYRDLRLQIESGPLLLYGTLAFSHSGYPTAVIPPYASIDGIRQGDSIRARHAILQMPPPQGADLADVFSTPLDTLRISAWGLEVYHFPLEHARLRILSTNGADILQAGDYLVDASIADGWNHASAFARINRRDTTAAIDFVADWNPDYIRQVPESKLPKALRGLDALQCTDTPRLHGYLSLERGFRPAWAAAHIRVGKIRYETLSLDYAHLRTLWDGHIINIDEAIAHSTEGYAATGRYWQNLSTDQYRIWAEGTLDPSALNALIPDQWWSQLWDDFRFNPAHWPQASFAMVGTHGMGVVGKRIFVEATMADTSYRGIPVQRAHAHLTMNGNIVDLYDLSVNTAQGDAIAHIRWDSGNEATSDQTMAFVASGSLPLDYIGAIIGEDTAATLAEFPTAIPPRASVLGVVVNSSEGVTEGTWLKMQVDFSAPVSYQWLHLDNARLNAYITPDERDLGEFSATLAGGALTGSVHIDVPDQSGENIAFQADIDLKAAQLQRLKHALDILNSENSVQAAGSKNPSATGEEISQPALPPEARAAVKAVAAQIPAGSGGLLDQRGLVNFQGKISGVIGKTSTFEGDGNIHIYQAELGQVRLLGQISALFQYLGLPLGVLSFTDAQTSWQMQNGIVHMPDLDVTGVTALLDASGNIDIETAQINFIVYLQPFGEVSMPVLSQALGLFSPLSKMVNVSVSGPLADPQFNTNFAPLGIFRSRQQVPAQQMQTPPPAPPQEGVPTQKKRKPFSPPFAP